MKFLLKTHSKKIIIFILSAMIVLSTLTVGLAVATSVEKVVVDAAGNLTDGASAPDGSIIKKFTTIRQAIDYIDSTGAEEGTIYINGTYATTDHESISGTNTRTGNYAPMTITGYNGQADKLDLSGSYYHIVQGGQLTIENITFGTPTDDTGLVYINGSTNGYLYKGFWAFDKFIFGEGVVMSGNGLRLGGGYGDSGVDNNVEIHSGTYNYVYPAGLPWESSTKLNRSVYYDFYGGTVNNLYGGYISTSGSASCITGDYVVNVYGGTFNKPMHLGASGNAGGYVAGNTIYNIQGGTVSSVNFGTDYTEDTAARAGRGNIAIIINGAKDSLTNVTATHPDYIGKSEGKKFMVIINNAEGGMGTVDTSNEKLINKLDYKVKVIGGKATPIFDGKGESSTFLGFAFEEDANAGNPILVNDLAVSPAGTTADGVTYYSVPSTAGTADFTTVTFDAPTVDAPEKIVVDAAGTLTDGAIDASGYKIKEFSNIQAAIDYLNGEEGTVYINGTFTDTSTNAHEKIAGTDKSKTREQVTITGYNGTADKLDISTSYFHFTNRGVLKFENITFVTLSTDSADTSGNMPKAVWSGGGVIFGENVVMSGKGLRLGGGYGTEAMWQPSTNYVTAYSGTFSYVYPAGMNSSGDTRLERKVVYSFYGGTVSNLYGGYISTGGAPYLAGDYIVNVGGTASFPGGMNLGSRANSKGYVAGNTIYNIEGGNVPYVNFGTDYPAYAATDAGRGNIAIIINGSKDSTTEIRANAADFIGKSEGKKFALIVNNAEGGKVTFNTEERYAEEMVKLMNKLDYKVAVIGGEAQPVFDCEGENSTLLGFSIKDAANLGFTVLVNGQVATPAGTTADDVAYYTVPSTAGTTDYTTVTFLDTRKPIVTDDEDFSSSDYKVFATLEEAVAALGAEGGTVYIDGAITAAAIEGATAARGDVVIEGFTNATKDSLTITNAAAALQGNVTFENLTLATGNKFSVGANTVTFGEGTVNGGVLFGDGPFPGNFVVDSADFTISSIALGGSGATVPSNVVLNNGSIVKSGQFAMLLGIFSNCTYSGLTQTGDMSFTMNGGSIQHLHVGYVGSAYKDWGSGRVNGAGGDVYFTGNTFFNMNAGTVTDKVYFGTVSTLAYAYMNNIVYTFNGATMDNAVVVATESDRKPYLQRNPATPDAKWIVISNNAEKGMTTVDESVVDILDYYVTVTGGKAEAVFEGTTFKGFRITSDTEGLAVYANGKMLMPNEEGLYDLTITYTNDVEITFAEAEAIYSDGETVTVLSDCEITVAELEHRYKEGYIFLGWKLNGAYTAATVSVKAGDKLTAEYAAYNAAEQFYVKGIQMRTTGAQGVRFILSKQNSLDSILIGAGLSIKEFGSLILPVELTHGKDMEYGKPIYKGDTTEILGTPSAVKADKLYAETESGVEYTVVVTGISAEKYYRFYAVQGYLVYTDANGNEQVVYSTYGQSSLYRAALHLAADEEAEESAKAQAQAVIDYVQNVRPESYKNYYLASVEKTDLGYTAVKGENYALANGLKVVEFTFDFFGGQGEAINIVNFADTHLNYVNKQDFGAADPITMSEYLNRGWNKNGGNAVDALRAMEFASFADKTIITGDTYDYYSYGGFQMAQRLLYNYNNEIGTYTDAKGITRNNNSVLVAIGNHEPFKRFEGTIPYVSDHEALADSLNARWNNDIVYHSEDIVKGENAVKVVVLNNQSRKITREEILTKLTADIEAARSAGTKILVFQHVPFYECSDEDVEGTLTNQVYELIKGNADVVKAVIAGDVHNYDYRETAGTNGTLVEITTGAIAEHDENSVCNIIIK